VVGRVCEQAEHVLGEDMDSGRRGAAYLGRGSFGRASYWDRITRTLGSLHSLGQLLKQSYTATAPRKTLLVVHLHTYELNVLPV